MRISPVATVALEAGTHSPWISRYLTDLGTTVLVANPRKLHAISHSERKCDRRDARMLARLARVDAALLHPIQHGSAPAQHDLLGLKLREVLVRSRVSLINAVRFTLKSLGHPDVLPEMRGRDGATDGEKGDTCWRSVLGLLDLPEMLVQNAGLVNKIDQSINTTSLSVHQRLCYNLMQVPAKAPPDKPSVSTLTKIRFNRVATQRLSDHLDCPLSTLRQMPPVSPILQTLI